MIHSSSSFEGRMVTPFGSPRGTGSSASGRVHLPSWAPDSGRSGVGFGCGRVARARCGDGGAQLRGARPAAGCGFPVVGGAPPGSGARDGVVEPVVEDSL